MKNKHALLIFLIVFVFVISGCKPALRKFNSEDCFLGYAENVRCLHGIVFWDVFVGTGYIPAEFISLIEDINPDKGSPVDPRPGYVIYAYQIIEFPDEEPYLQIILDSPIHMAEIWIEGSLNSESNPLMYGGYANIIKVIDIRPLNTNEYEELYRKYSIKAE